MSIERRDRRGEYRVRLRRQTINVSATFASKSEAAAYEAAVLAAIATGQPPPPPPRRRQVGPSITVEDACRELLKGMESGSVTTRAGHRYKPATIRAMECRLRLHVVPALGNVPLRALRRADVRRLIEHLAVQRSAETALGVRDSLRSVLQRQVDLEVVEVNVAAGVRAPSPDRAPARFLTPAEADELQDVADAHQNATIGPFVAMALGTGLRCGTRAVEGDGMRVQ